MVQRFPDSPLLTAPLRRRSLIGLAALAGGMTAFGRIGSAHAASTNQLLSRSGWKVSASSHPTDMQHKGQVPACAIDGNANTRWSTGRSQARGQWFEIDFGRNVACSGVIIDAGSGKLNYPREYFVYLSLDGKHWGGSVGGTKPTNRRSQVSFKPRTARYVRVICAENAKPWWTIAEINALTPVPPAPKPVPKPSTSPALLVVPAVNGVGARLAMVSHPETRILLKGVTVWGIPDRVTVIGGFAQGQYDNRDAICADIVSHGGNHIRLRVLADEFIHHTVVGSAENYIKYVTDWVATATAHGLRVYISSWDTTDSSDGSTRGANWVVNYRQTFPMWAAIMAALRQKDGSNNPWVFFEPVNEPWRVSWSQLVTVMTAYIGYFRTNLHYDGVLVIDTIDWSHGYDDGSMTLLEQVDAKLLGGRHNLVFARHDYAQDSVDNIFNPSAWASAIGGSSTKHVIFESEFGNENNGNLIPSWSAAIAAYLTSQVFDDHSNLAGSTAFLRGNWGDGNAMSTDPIGKSVTAWGADINSYLRF